MKKLEILVPQFNETDEIAKQLLDSIALQQAVDFNDVGVIICNGGSDILLSDKLLGSYPFDIAYHRIPNRGISGTRNALLDYATAEYVMFCDADDIFYSACGLWLIFREMSFGQFDTMASEFIEEVRRKDGSTVFVKHEMDSTFVHGKVHRRQYLIDNNIRWNENLTVHEDSYFNILAQSFTEVKYCPISFYMWKYREGSISRADPKYLLKTYTKLIDSCDELVHEFERRGCDHDVEFQVVMMIFNAYYTLNKPQWFKEENAEYRDATEKRFASFYKEHKAAWDGAKMENKIKASNHARARNVREGMGLEAMTIEQWLAHIATL